MTDLIKGYRNLTTDEIATINKIKGVGDICDQMIAALAKQDVDPRWLAIAKTDLQTGLMAAVRAVARPTNF